jgi:phosphoenolpyruvate carboxykinase (ATP)
VESKILNPQNIWKNPTDWDIAARSLGEKFIKNFENFTDNDEGKRLVAAGPKI